jgi:hypothetical protein
LTARRIAARPCKIRCHAHGRERPDFGSRQASSPGAPADPGPIRPRSESRRIGGLDGPRCSRARGRKPHGAALMGRAGGSWRVNTRGFCVGGAMNPGIAVLSAFVLLRGPRRCRLRGWQRGEPPRMYADKGADRPAFMLTRALRAGAFRDCFQPTTLAALAVAIGFSSRPDANSGAVPAAAQGRSVRPV